MLKDELPREMREALSAELDEDETLLWADQPVAKRMYRRAWIASGFLCSISASCSIAFGAFAVLDASDSDKHIWIARLFFGGLSLACLVATIVVGLAPRGAREAARRTVYAVTQTRLLILEVKKDGRVHTQSLEPGHPLLIVRQELPDNCGDIMVGRRTRVGEKNAALSQEGLALEATPDSRSVEKIIRKTFDPPPPAVHKESRP
jgi:hypothetical protein